MAIQNGILGSLETGLFRLSLWYETKGAINAERLTIHLLVLFHLTLRLKGRLSVL